MFPLSMRNAGENQLMFNLTFPVRISRFPPPHLQSDLSPFKYIVSGTLPHQMGRRLLTHYLQWRKGGWHIRYVLGKSMLLSEVSCPRLSTLFLSAATNSRNCIASPKIASRPAPPQPTFQFTIHHHPTTSRC
jgi:hypothetical protein